MKLKRTLTSIVALLLACIMPLSAIAATYEVATGAELAEKFNATTEDATVDITITADITDTIGDLNSQSGKTYTINANSDENGTKYEIKQSVTVKGDGDVSINTNINTSGDALTVEGGANVTVDGSITSSNGDGVVAKQDGNENSPTVVIKDDIIVENVGVNASGDSNVTVDGDITSNSKQGKGVSAQGNAEVEVTGKVESKDANTSYAYSSAGVSASDNSKVTPW